MPNVGQLIRNKREAVGLSQKKLGIVCGLSDSEIMKIENGVRKKPNWNNLCRIAQALDFHPFELMLAAGYISENDVHPSSLLNGLEKLDSRDIEYLQMLIDFMIFRRKADGAKEGGM